MLKIGDKEIKAQCDKIIINDNGWREISNDGYAILSKLLLYLMANQQLGEIKKPLLDTLINCDVTEANKLGYMHICNMAEFVNF